MPTSRPLGAAASIAPALLASLLLLPSPSPAQAPEAAHAAHVPPAAHPAPTTPTAPLVRWHDNDRPAGSLRDGRFTLALEVVPGEWRYLGDDQPGVPVLAFREVGGDPVNPGPLIRVPEGTEVEVSVANGAGRTLVVHGLTTRRTEHLDSLVVPPGETGTARFTADAAGTWYYWGTTMGASLVERRYEDSQLTGGFLVDPPGAALERERLLVMSIFYPGLDADGDPDFAGEVFAINGRPWPLTERLEYDMGETVRWRIINVAQRSHPMHLHGFHFGVDGVGDNESEQVHGPRQRRLAVTESMPAGGTLRLSFTPDRPGGWLFHCHIGWHVIPNAAPAQYASGMERAMALFRPHHQGPAHDHVVHGMGGLMMAVEVRKPAGWKGMEEPTNRIRLFVQTDSVPGEPRRRFGYVLGQGGEDPPRDSVAWPGPTLIAHAGEPTAVTVINRTSEATQVHWHGLELESYYDGAAGVGGFPGARSPAIEPGDSFTMRITPPRAGSFMYHTHVDDLRQQTGGLYGGFVVLEPGATFDPSRDLVFLASSDLDVDPILNGSTSPPARAVRVGETVRIRAMNITFQNGGLRYRLVKPDGDPVMWEHVAKDGADLPPHQRAFLRADQVVSVGETFDFLFTPRVAETLRLEIRSFGGQLFASQDVEVLPEP